MKGSMTSPNIKQDKKLFALGRVQTAARKKKEAEEFFEESIVTARANGCTLREIEKVAGVSNVTVLNWSRRSKKRNKQLELEL